MSEQETVTIPKEDYELLIRNEATCERLYDEIYFYRELICKLINKEKEK